MIIIDIEKKLRAYHGSQVLHIQRQVIPGTITKIYGPSGEGKSTLLKIIAGLTSPEKGMISFNGEVWLNTSLKINIAPQKRKCGFVFQNYALFPNMTVQQHLEYATADEQWIKRLLALGKLETLTSHKPEYLSGGQQQRLAILRALAIKPRIILMDEPFSALDPEMKDVLIAGLKDILAELQATTFIVSHNPHELEGMYEQEIHIRSEI